MGRVLHTSDWHLGRQVGRRSRGAEFGAVLAEIIEIAADFRPDLIVHSGDVFDTWRPGLDDLMRASHALRRLGEIAPVAVVAGNHDTPTVLSFLEFVENDIGRIAPQAARVHFATRAAPGDFFIAEYPTAAGELTIRLGALPYLHPNRFTYEFADPAMDTATYAERMRAVQAEIYRRLQGGRGASDVLVYAAHLFIEGAVPSFSEKPISITEDYAVAAGDLPDVAYGALGHIHKPQRIDRAGYPARYAGSPLQMDFGEAGDAKSVVLAEIAPGRQTRIETAQLTSGRPLVRLEGTLEQITTSASRVGDAWVKAIVTVEEHIPYLAETLAKMLPQATIVDIDERRVGSDARVLDRTASSDELPNDEDLFRAYLAERGTGGRAVGRVMAALADLKAEPEPENPAPCCEERLLAAAIAGQSLDGIDRAGLLARAGEEAAR